MRDVYANSSCNISAVASVDSDGGLFRSRSPSDVWLGTARREFSGGPEKDYFILDHDYWERQVSRAELHRCGDLNLQNYYHGL